MQTYLKDLNKPSINSNFLAFFMFLFEQFFLLDPDPHSICVKMNVDPNPGGKMNADPDSQP